MGKDRIYSNACTWLKSESGLAIDFSFRRSKIGIFYGLKLNFLRIRIESVFQSLARESWARTKRSSRETGNPRSPGSRAPFTRPSNCNSSIPISRKRSTSPSQSAPSSPPRWGSRKLRFHSAPYLIFSLRQELHFDQSFTISLSLYEELVRN